MYVLWRIGLGEIVMLKKTLLIKIIAILIVQALFVTQVDFSLAAAYESKEALRESVLRVKNIQDTFTSLVMGIGNLDLRTTLHILKGYGATISELIQKGEVFSFNKDLYKAFITFNVAYKTVMSLNGKVKHSGKDKERISIDSNIQKRGPPSILNIVLNVTRNRTVVA